MPRQYRRYTPYVRSTTWPHDVFHLKDVPTVLEQTKAQTLGSYLGLNKKRVNFSSGPAELPSLGDCSILFHCCVPLRSGGFCAQTLACQAHGLEAKKAVAGRRISQKAWTNLQDPESYLRCGREAPQARRADKKGKAEASSVHTCPTCETSHTDTTSPASQGVVPDTQQYLDPVGVMLVLMVYSMLIAYALGVVSLKRLLAKGDAWITARLQPACVRQEEAESLSRRDPESRITDVTCQQTTSSNTVEDVPDKTKDLDLAVSRAINNAKELALEVEAYRREFAAPPTIIDGKKVAIEMETAHRLKLAAPRNIIDAKQVAAEVEAHRCERRQELQKELKIHLHKAANVASQDPQERQDESRLLDDIERLSGLRLIWESSKKTTLDPPVKDKVGDFFFPFSAYQSEGCGRIFRSHGYVYEEGSCSVVLG
ncbi:MAG: hypothetical protein LQ344_007406 [Seirophora lacunosa]|nr:MAG: hypothetical protein LQ344_007406 [Seirophora lacunosa]